MTDVKWIKIVTDIFDDEKVVLIESMPDADSLIVIWFKILCLAGKQNNGGVLMLNDRFPFTDEMLATIFRRPLQTVRMALKVFADLGMIEIVSGAVTIPNWEKHQTLGKLEREREQTRQRVANHRANQRQLAECNANSNVTVTQCNATEKNREDKRKRNSPTESKEKDSLSPDLEKALAQFQEHRKRLKAPMTDLAVTLMLKKLCDLSGGDERKKIAIINQSIENGWKGVFPLHDEKTPGRMQKAKTHYPQHEYTDKQLDALLVDLDETP